MRVRLLTLRYSPTLGAFDDSPLRELLRDKDLLSFREHFFAVEGIPHLACVVTWQEAVVPIMATEAKSTRSLVGSSATPKSGSDTASLTNEKPVRLETEADRLLFDAFRDWRARRSSAEGVPPYVLFNNKQLYAIISKKPENKTALQNIDGVGPAKIERYGDAVLAILHGPPASSNVTNTDVAAATTPQSPEVAAP